MDETEFDKFAEEYEQLHSRNIRISGESTSFFAEYKIRDVALKILRSQPEKQLKILDFGSGVGSSVPYLRGYFPKSKITCLDVSQKSLAIARARFGAEVEFIHFSGQEIPAKDASYDLVFSSCVFHHIDSNKHMRLLGEIYRVLKVGGRAVVFEHNPYNPLTLYAVNTCRFDTSAVLIKPFLLKLNLRKVGLRNVVCKFRIFFPGWLKWLRPFERLITWCPLGAQYYVTGYK